MLHNTLSPVRGRRPVGPYLDGGASVEKIKQFLRAFTPRRRVMYLVGLVILACGLTLNKKTNLGISPILSVANAIAELTGISFSVMTFIYYCFLILLQFLMDREGFEQIQWLQLVVSFLTSAFIELYDRFLPQATVLWTQIPMLLLAILLTGIGVILTVGARFVPNPADGTVNSIAKKTKLSLGLSKNVLDVVSIAVALALGLIFRGQVIGIGLGTVIAMLLTGRVISLLQKPLLRLTKLDREP